MELETGRGKAKAEAVEIAFDPSWCKSKPEIQNQKILLSGANQQVAWTVKAFCTGRRSGMSLGNVQMANRPSRTEDQDEILGGVPEGETGRRRIEGTRPSD